MSNNFKEIFMKKTSLAALFAATLLVGTAANADGTVKGQAKAAPAATTASAPAAPSVAGRHSPTAELIARPGNKRSIFELDFMIPVYQMMDRMLFVDLRGQMDTKRNKEANLGMGYRQVMQNSFVLGGYAYGDFRRTKRGNNYTQITLGAEALSVANLLDFRVNGYIPVGTKQKRVNGGDRARYAGTGLISSSQFEKAMSGFDGEVGVRIPMPGMNSVETRVFAGGYYFKASGVKKVTGPRGRLEVRINDIINSGSRLTLGLEVSNDKVRKTNVFGHIGLRIPMQFMSGGKVPQGLARRLADYVVRDVDIVTNDYRVDNAGAAVNSKTNAAYKFWHVDPNAAAGGDGSVEKPLQALPTGAGAQALTAGDIIVAHKTGAASVTANAAALALLNNMEVWGERNEQSITDARFGRSYGVDRVSTQVQTITNNGGANVFTGNNANVRLTGFNYDSQQANGSLLDSTGHTAAGTYAQEVSFVNATVNAAVTASVLNFANGGIAGANLTATVTDSKLTASANNAAQLFVNGTANGTSTFTLNSARNATTYVSGANEGVGIQVNAAGGSTLNVNDTGSTYTNCARAINYVAAGGNAADKVTLNVSGATVNMDANATAGVQINRTNVALAQAVSATIKDSTFNNASAVASVVIGGQVPAAAAYGVTLNSSGNQYNNTVANGSGIAVTGDTNAGSASVLTINSTKDTFTGVAGTGNAFKQTGVAAATTGVINFKLVGVKTSGYTSAIATAGSNAGLTGLAAPGGYVKFDLTSGDNIIDAITNSVSNAAAAGAADSLIYNLGAGNVNYAAAAATGQFKKALA